MMATSYITKGHSKTSNACITYCQHISRGWFSAHTGKARGVPECVRSGTARAQQRRRPITTVASFSVTNHTLLDEMHS